MLVIDTTMWFLFEEASWRAYIHTHMLFGLVAVLERNTADGAAATNASTCDTS